LFALAACEYYGEHDDHHHHEHHGVGYSYAKFSGPVSGPEHEIKVEDKHGKHSVDYVAKPDYSFEYGVEDPKSHVSQNRKEHRHGDEVHGEYSLVQPDGKTRTVKYTSDHHNGFQAEVLVDGHPLHHEEKQLLAQHEQAHHYEHEHQPHQQEYESHSDEGHSDDGHSEEGHGGYY
jgi:Insect cuticle protein